MTEAPPESPMVEMSRAICLVLERYGPTLAEIPDGPLNEFAQIVPAFAADLRDEVNRRDQRS